MVLLQRFLNFYRQKTKHYKAVYSSLLQRTFPLLLTFYVRTCLHFYTSMFYKLMFKKISLFTLIFFSFTYSFSQSVKVEVVIENKVASPASDTIYYDIDKPLTWSDFQGQPDYNHFGGAITASGFAFDADIKILGDDLYLKIGVYIFFSKKKSWKKPDINSPYHLLHEQRHFDITRIGAANFVQQIAQANFTKNNYQKLMTSIFDKAYAESVAMQQQYDRETNHSINKEEQLKWNDKIYEQLKTALNKN